MMKAMHARNIPLASDLKVTKEDIFMSNKKELSQMALVVLEHMLKDIDPQTLEIEIDEKEVKIPNLKKLIHI
jgi:hypothetical protein